MVVTFISVFGKEFIVSFELLEVVLQILAV